MLETKAYAFSFYLNHGGVSDIIMKYMLLSFIIIIIISEEIHFLMFPIYKWRKKSLAPTQKVIFKKDNFNASNFTD